MKKLLIVALILIMLLVTIAAVPVSARGNGNPHDGEPPGWSHVPYGDGEANGGGSFDPPGGGAAP